MRRRATRLTLLLAPAALLLPLLAACGSDDSHATEESHASDDSHATEESHADEGDDHADDEEASAGEGMTPVPAEVADGAATIAVTVGVDDFTTTGDRVVSVPLGTVVTIEVSSTEAAEYHLHGYDIEAEGEADAMASITFTADEAGLFDLESHETEDVLLVLAVTE